MSEKKRRKGNNCVRDRSIETRMHSSHLEVHQHVEVLADADLHNRQILRLDMEEGEGKGKGVNKERRKGN